jgi:hypothetical protein
MFGLTIPSPIMEVETSAIIEQLDVIAHFHKEASRPVQDYRNALYGLRLQ